MNKVQVTPKRKRPDFKPEEAQFRLLIPNPSNGKKRMVLMNATARHAYDKALGWPSKESIDTIGQANQAILEQIALGNACWED